MESFTPGSLSDDALLSFALTHNYINNFKTLKPSPDRLSVLVPAALVDRTTTKYFGRTTAIIKKATTGSGGERWILTEYAVIEGAP